MTTKCENGQKSSVFLVARRATRFATGCLSRTSLMTASELFLPVGAVRTRRGNARVSHASAKLSEPLPDEADCAAAAQKVM